MYQHEKYFVYIIANKRFTVFYVGITNNLERRIWEHKNSFNKQAFSSKYNLKVLLYYEYFNFIEDAILREKQLKAGSRWRKELLVMINNPRLQDLAADWYS